jgi:large conductance mechanosensitive channel
MPLVGIVIGGLDFSELSFDFRGNVVNYGVFIQNIVDFLIISACIFAVMKFMNNFKRKKEEPAPAETPKETPEDIKLLTEIRDLLKKENKKK